MSTTTREPEYAVGDETLDDTRATEADERRLNREATERQRREVLATTPPRRNNYGPRPGLRVRRHQAAARARYRRFANRSSGVGSASFAELVVGAIAYAAGINYLRGGFPQVKQWFAAKFYNATEGTQAPGPSIFAGGQTAGTGATGNYGSTSSTPASSASSSSSLAPVAQAAGNVAGGAQSAIAAIGTAYPASPSSTPPVVRPGAA